MQTNKQKQISQKPIYEDNGGIIIIENYFFSSLLVFPKNNYIHL